MTLSHSKTPACRLYRTWVAEVERSDLPGVGVGRARGKDAFASMRMAHIEAECGSVSLSLTATWAETGRSLEFSGQPV